MLTKLTTAVKAFLSLKMTPFLKNWLMPIFLGAYGGFLASMLILEWPHSAGWFTALLWFILYVVMMRMNERTMKLCKDIMKSWDETMEQLFSAYKIIEKMQAEKKALTEAQKTVHE